MRQHLSFREHFWRGNALPCVIDATLRQKSDLQVLLALPFAMSTDIPQVPEGVEAMIGPLSFLGNDNRAPCAQ